MRIASVLFSHDRLAIAGNCRMCLVEVSPGPPKPQVSVELDHLSVTFQALWEHWLTMVHDLFVSMCCRRHGEFYQ